jgi:hypothetical protein
MSFIDNLIYYIIIQLDLSFAISCLNIFVLAPPRSTPQEIYMTTTKRIFSMTKRTLKNSFIIKSNINYSSTQKTLIDKCILKY